MQARTFKRSAIAHRGRGRFRDRRDHRGQDFACTRAHAASRRPAVAAAAARRTPGRAARFQRAGRSVRRRRGQHQRDCGRDEGGSAASSRGMPDLDELPPFFRGMPMPSQSPRADARPGFRLHHRPRRHHHDQRARRRGRRRGDGQARRQARVHGQGARQRQDHRRRGAQDRRQEPADREDRQSRNHAGRRMGGRHRHAVRLREHGDLGHRQRQVALAARRFLCAVHPDRRCDQSRQLGRTAVQPARAKSSASTRRSSAAAADRRAWLSPCRSTSRCRWRPDPAAPAKSAMAASASRSRT